MGSSAILRRCTGIMRISANSGFFRSESAANRMMSTAPAAAPWLMLPPAVEGSGKITYKFHCLANKTDRIHTNELAELDLPPEIDIVKDVEFVGASHGWLALYNRRSSDLFLSNPIADRHVKLPPLRGPVRVILSSSSLIEEEGEGEPLAFAALDYSRGGIGLCSPRRRGGEWTRFGRDCNYDNLVYSPAHKRLFCACREIDKKSIRLESWNVGVGVDSPELDWVIRGIEELDLDSYYHKWPGRRWEFKSLCFQMAYLVCDESSGDLYLVVRHVNRQAGPYGSVVNKVILSKWRGTHYIRTPYKTADFDVFKVDSERGEVIHMKDSLGGLAMFVGINHSFAMNPVAGVKADSIYFADENRLVEPTRLERAAYGGHDNGVFDYRSKEFYPCCDFYPIEYDRIRKILPLPLWFTPTTAAADSK